MHTNIKGIGVALLGVEAEFTAPDADALFTRPSDVYLEHSVC